MVEEREVVPGLLDHVGYPTADMLAQTLQFLLPMGLGHRSMPAAGMPFHHGGKVFLQSIDQRKQAALGQGSLGHAQDVFTYLSTEAFHPQAVAEEPGEGSLVVQQVCQVIVLGSVDVTQALIAIAHHEPPAPIQGRDQAVPRTGPAITTDVLCRPIRIAQAELGGQVGGHAIHVDVPVELLVGDRVGRVQCSCPGDHPAQVPGAEAAPR